MEVIRVGMRLFYDGEPCIVQGLRKISTGQPVEEAKREEFSDIVAILTGQGWEVRVRLTDQEVEKFSEAVEEALPAEAVASGAVEERMPIDWEAISGREPTDLEEVLHPPEERREEEVDIEEIPGDMDVEVEE